MTTTPAATTELPRLIRYVPAGALPGSKLLAVFDPSQNFLLINRDAFDSLDPSEQRGVLRTHRTLTIP